MGAIVGTTFAVRSWHGSCLRQAAFVPKACRASNYTRILSVHCEWGVDLLAPVQTDFIDEQSLGQSPKTFHCAMHGTVTACPFAYVACDVPGDPSEPRGLRVAQFLKEHRQCIQEQKQPQAPPLCGKPWHVSL